MNSSDSEWHKLSLIDLAYILPATILGGWFLGYLLKRYTGWESWEMIGVIMGGLGGLATLIQRVLYIAKQDEENAKQDNDHQ